MVVEEQDESEKYKRQAKVVTEEVDDSSKLDITKAKVCLFMNVNISVFKFEMLISKHF